ncbi:MAG: ABC transporter permease [Pseudomonadota bacterium]
MAIARYFVVRIMSMLGILSGVVFLTFAISRLLPSSPVEALLGGRPTPELIAAKKAELGLDEGLLTQFFIYIKSLFSGDFGDSLLTGQSVLLDLIERLPVTLELVTLAIAVSLVVGIPLGVLAALRANKFTDSLIRLGSVAGIAAPVFFLSVLLQMLFYSHWRLLPLQGRIDSELELDYPFDVVTGFYLIDPLLQGNWIAWWDALQHLILPVLALGIGTAPIFVRLTRNLLIDSLGSEHVKTFQAYRLRKRDLYGRYALRPALIPVLTFAGLVYGYMIGNSVFVEFIFDLPGLGGYVVDALVANDFNAVMGVTLVLSAIYLMVNLLIDVTYYALDPRLRR